MGGVWATSFVTIATARGTVQVSTAKVTEPQDRQNFIVTIVSGENKISVLIFYLGTLTLAGAPGSNRATAAKRVLHAPHGGDN